MISQGRTLLRPTILNPILPKRTWVATLLLLCNGWSVWDWSSFLVLPETQGLDEKSHLERVITSLWPLLGEWVLACWFGRHTWCPGAKFSCVALICDNSFFFLKFKKMKEIPPNDARFLPEWHTYISLGTPCTGVCWPWVSSWQSQLQKQLCFVHVRPKLSELSPRQGRHAQTGVHRVSSRLQRSS